YFNALVERIRRSYATSELQTDWSAKTAGFSPDLVLSLNPRVAYKSSWMNLPINFPGFLLWVPAGHGYVYKVDLDTEGILYAADGTELQRRAIPMEYELRQAELDRTALAEISWFEVGIISLISGIYGANNFDPDVVEPFQAHVRENYASYIMDQLYPALQEAS